MCAIRLGELRHLAVTGATRNDELIGMPGAVSVQPLLCFRFLLLPKHELDLQVHLPVSLDNLHVASDRAPFSVASGHGDRFKGMEVHFPESLPPAYAQM